MMDMLSVHRIMPVRVRLAHGVRMASSAVRLLVSVAARSRIRTAEHLRRKRQTQAEQRALPFLHGF